MGFGEKIKNYRLEKNLSYGQIYTQTKISQDFIESLEKEQFSHLPFYAYSRGLLLNLLEVYSVSTPTLRALLQEFSQLYHQHQKPEESDRSIPLPSSRKGGLENNKNNNEKNIMSETLTKPNNHDEAGERGSVIKKITGDEEEPSEENRLKNNISSTVKWTVVIVLTLILGLLFFFFKDTQARLSNDEKGSGEIISREGRMEHPGVYSLYDKFNTFSLTSGDLVKIFFNDRIFNFRMNSINVTFNNEITINFDLNSDRLIKIYLFEEEWVDIDEDGQNDLLIKFQKVSGEVAIVFFSLIKERSQSVNYEAIWSRQEKMIISTGETVLLEDQNKAPIQVYIKATSLPVYLSYNLDGQRQNVVNLLPGNTVNLIAQDHMELQIGNFRSVNLVLNYMPLVFKLESSEQFSLAKIIKWLPSYHNETKYDLIIKDYIE